MEELPTFCIADRLKESAKIGADVAEYIRKGGKVKACEAGATGFGKSATLKRKSVMLKGSVIK